MSATDTGSLLEAMLAVQAEAPTLEKDRTAKIPTKNGGEYSYSYADLKGIVEKIRPLLTKNGLVWSAKPSWMENVGPSLKYKLAHAPSREMEEGEMPLMLDIAESSAQEMGSAITYMRRYALVAVLDLVADTDDDGALASSRRGGGSKRAASEKQLGYVKSLLKRNQCTTADIRARLRAAGVTVGDDENPVPLVDSLTGAQASAVIESMKDGSLVTTGESDVPADADGFTHPPAGPEPDLEPGPGQFDVGAS